MLLLPGIVCLKHGVEPLEDAVDLGGPFGPKLGVERELEPVADGRLVGLHLEELVVSSPADLLGNADRLPPPADDPHAGRQREVLIHRRKALHLLSVGAELHQDVAGVPVDAVDDVVVGVQPGLEFLELG